jgi:hypothetical protein
MYICISKGVKNKVHSITCHEDPEGKWRYSSTISLTSALEGVGDQRHAPVALTPGKKPGTHCTGGWVGPMGGLTGAENIDSNGIRSPDRLFQQVTVRVASVLTQRKLH